jgi:hypothetical protein
VCVNGRVVWRRCRRPVRRGAGRSDVRAFPPGCRLRAFRVVPVPQAVMEPPAGPVSASVRRPRCPGASGACAFALRPPRNFCLSPPRRGPAPEGRYSSSIAFSLATFSASPGSAGAENQASRISLATISEVPRRLMQRTLAWFQARAPRAVSASPHKAARIPGTLFAAMDTPVPVQQKSTPWSATPVTTDSATVRATSGQVCDSPLRGPARITSCPRRRRSASTASVRCDLSSLPRAIRNCSSPGHRHFVRLPTPIIG